MTREIENGPPSEYAYRELTGAVIGAAMDVHSTREPGLLESAYESCLVHELLLRGIPFQREVELPVVYKGHLVDGGFRIDLLVADAVVLELKSSDKLLPIHEAQLLTYMKLAGKTVGLLINFNVESLKSGITRRVL